MKESIYLSISQCETPENNLSHTIEDSIYYHPYFYRLFKMYSRLEI